MAPLGERSAQSIDDHIDPLSIFLISRDFSPLCPILLSPFIWSQIVIKRFFQLKNAKYVPNQLSVAEEESQKKQQYGMIQGLLRESNSLREELHNLSCLTQIKAEERGQKHRELLRAEVQYKHKHMHTKAHLDWFQCHH